MAIWQRPKEVIGGPLYVLLLVPLSYTDLFLSYQITRRIAIDYGQKHNKAWHTNMPMYDRHLDYPRLKR